MKLQLRHALYVQLMLGMILLGILLLSTAICLRDSEEGNILEAGYNLIQFQAGSGCILLLEEVPRVSVAIPLMMHQILYFHRSFMGFQL